MLPQLTKIGELLRRVLLYSAVRVMFSADGSSPERTA
jgi:hypothetical protein